MKAHIPSSVPLDFLSFDRGGEVDVTVDGWSRFSRPRGGACQLDFGFSRPPHLLAACQTWMNRQPGHPADDGWNRFHSSRFNLPISRSSCSVQSRLIAVRQTIIDQTRNSNGRRGSLDRSLNQAREFRRLIANLDKII